MSYWLNQGAPKEKLNLAVPSYGRTFTLADPQLNGVNASAIGPGRAGPYTRQDGTLGYNEICEQHKAGDWNVVFDWQRRVPYAYKDNQWVSYDNVQ